MKKNILAVIIVFAAVNMSIAESRKINTDEQALFKGNVGVSVSFGPNFTWCLPDIFPYINLIEKKEHKKKYSEIMYSYQKTVTLMDVEMKELAMEFNTTCKNELKKDVPDKKILNEKIDELHAISKKAHKELAKLILEAATLLKSEHLLETMQINEQKEREKKKENVKASNMWPSKDLYLSVMTPEQKEKYYDIILPKYPDAVKRGKNSEDNYWAKNRLMIKINELLMDDNPDIKLIDQIIDEVFALSIKEYRDGNGLIMEVNKMLTPEQIAEFKMPSMDSKNTIHINIGGDGKIRTSDGKEFNGEVNIQKTVEGKIEITEEESLEKQKEK